jgi:hypothetical protein
VPASAHFDSRRIVLIHAAKRSGRAPQATTPPKFRALGETPTNT